MIELYDKHKQAMALSLRETTNLMVFEGTIRSSKTVLAIEIFLLKCLYSRALNHLISARDYDTINNNILQCNGFGVISLHGSRFKLKKDRVGSYYIAYKNMYGEECRILMAGYSNASSWKKILGGTICNILIDEVNTADKQFVEECFARQTNAENPLMIWTLNGDNPDHFIYQDYINRCKPLGYVPKVIADDMNRKENHAGWYYYHWTMDDNPTMTLEKKERIQATYPLNSYYYNIKILGIRGKAEGAIFANYLNDEYIDDRIGLIYRNNELLTNNFGQVQTDFIKYSIGLDLGNNENKKGTVITITGFTKGYDYVVSIKYKQCESTEVNALINEIVAFVKEFYDSLPNKSLLDGVWVDGYGAIELLMLTLRNKIREEGMNIYVDLVNKFGKDNGRKARLDLMLMLVGSHRIKFRSSCKQIMRELSKLVYNEKDGLPLDENQEEMDFYDSLCYSLSTSMMKLVRRL